MIKEMNEMAKVHSVDKNNYVNFEYTKCGKKVADVETSEDCNSVTCKSCLNKM